MPRTLSGPVPPDSGRVPAGLAPVAVFAVSALAGFALAGFMMGAGSAPVASGVGGVAVGLLLLIVNGGLAAVWLARRRRVGVDAALRDPATGLYHRAYMEELVPRLAARDDRTGRSQIALILLRIDLFERLGSRYGPAFGDRALALVGQMIRSQTREGDVPARFDAQTLAVFLHSEDASQAAAFGRRLATLLDAEQIAVQGDEVKVSVSMGIAVRAAGEPLEALYRRAGDRLTQAMDGTAGRVLA